ncbi:hypothetical protein DM02DRAFT_634830 [Periconia macrospinosa]|uniref:Uncharacterized protein n=1 Tax=Periconia macrospinosa TaxID=97972 RepID=A0A2V1D539_9PLEO|nr:hypothetical protein DM02DRAFT_634830 [Periconia macrospinosa]
MEPIIQATQQVKLGDGTPPSKSSGSHLSFEELRRIQFLEAADFLIHRENYEDPFYRDFLDLFEAKGNESKEDFEESDHEEEADDEEEGEENDESGDGEDSEPEIPIFLDTTRREFLQEVTTALNDDKMRKAIKEAEAAGLKEWNDKMGEEDGEKFWRLLEDIPFDAPGSFFPLPTTQEEDSEREERKEMAQKEALKKAGLDEDDCFGHDPEVRDEVSIDRRTLIYFRSLYSILLDPTIEISQALKDGFLYRMEKAEYYTSWKVGYMYMNDWKLCNEAQRSSFLKTFSVDEESMKEWRKRLGEIRMCHTQSGFDIELDGLRDLIHEQTTLKWALPDLASLGINTEKEGSYKECPVCLVRLKDESAGDANDKHRATRVTSEGETETYGHCCYARYLENLEVTGSDGLTFERPYWDLYNGLAVLDMNPKAIKEGLELMKSYVDALPPRPAIQTSQADLEKYGALLRASVTELTNEIAKDDLLAVRQRLTEVRILGYYAAYDRLRAFADKDVSQYRQVSQTQADIRGLQGVLAFKHKVFEWYKKQLE